MAPQELREQQHKDLYRSFLRFRLTFEEEIRQPHFAEFLWIFETHAQFWNFRNRGRWVCQRCLKERVCVYGKQQGFQCLAYWWWSPQTPRGQTAMLQTIPLEDVTLQYLTHIQLLGIFYVRQYSLLTMADFSKVGLRSRLLEIAHEAVK